MTSFVLDASVTLSWIFEDEYSAYADQVSEILNNGQAIVPFIWPLEVANAILNAVRRRRLLETDAPILIGSINRLRIEVDHGITFESLLQTSFAVGLAHRLSAYDASYLELAIRRGLPLATEDAQLSRAASVAGIELLRP